MSSTSFPFQEMPPLGQNNIGTGFMNQPLNLPNLPEMPHGIPNNQFNPNPGFSMSPMEVNNINSEFNNNMQPFPALPNLENNYSNTINKPTKNKESLFKRIFGRSDNNKSDKQNNVNESGVNFDLTGFTNNTNIPKKKSDSNKEKNEKTRINSFFGGKRNILAEEYQARIDQNEEDLYNGNLLKELGIDFKKSYKKLYYVINPFADIPEEIGGFGDMTIIVYIIVLYGIAGMINKRESLHLAYVIKMFVYGMFFFYLLFSLMEKGAKKHIQIKSNSNNNVIKEGIGNLYGYNGNTLSMDPLQEMAMGPSYGGNSISLGIQNNTLSKKNQNGISNNNKFDFYVIGSALAYGLLPTIIVTYISMLFNLHLIKLDEVSLIPKYTTNYILLIAYISTTCWGAISSTKFINTAANKSFNNSKLLIAFPIVLYYIAFILLEFTYTKKVEPEKISKPTEEQTIN